MPLVRQKEVLINGDSEINSVGRAESAVLLNIITRLIHLRGDLQLTNLNKKNCGGSVTDTVLDSLDKNSVPQPKGLLSLVITQSIKSQK